MRKNRELTCPPPDLVRQATMYFGTWSRNETRRNSGVGFCSTGCHVEESLRYFLIGYPIDTRRRGLGVSFNGVSRGGTPPLYFQRVRI